MNNDARDAARYRWLRILGEAQSAAVGKWGASCDPRFLDDAADYAIAFDREYCAGLDSGRAPDTKVADLLVEIETLERQRDAAERREQATEQRARTLAARIDELMLEYCPDEMTPEQMSEWEVSQRFVKGWPPATIG